MDKIQVTGCIPICPTTEQKVHDLTMLYLKRKYSDSVPSPELLADNYLEVSKEILSKLQ